jgi:hypothetical protein
VPWVNWCLGTIYNSNSFPAGTFNQTFEVGCKCIDIVLQWVRWLTRVVTIYHDPSDDEHSDGPFAAILLTEAKEGGLYRHLLQPYADLSDGATKPIGFVKDNSTLTGGQMTWPWMYTGPGFLGPAPQGKVAIGFWWQESSFLNIQKLIWDVPYSNEPGQWGRDPNPHRFSCSLDNDAARHFLDDLDSTLDNA